MKGQYRGLVIAGLGAVGRAVLALGAAELESFEKIVLIDREERVEKIQVSDRARFIQGDVTSTAFLEAVLAAIPKPALFVNLCAGIDNVAVRRAVGRYDMAYLDSCCCAPAGSKEVRFSRMMAYSLQTVAARRPQWLCWGINPGLVELVTRRLIASFGEARQGFDVTVYEYDQLEKGKNDTIAVGWCPDALIEEVMQSPTLRFVEGLPLERTQQGAESVIACWDGEPVRSRLVGHEDIWNIGKLPEVRNASFVYGLHPKVMQVFDQGIDMARRQLRVPAPQEPVFGLERVAVAVQSRDSGEEKVLVWQEDHHRIWQNHHLNAVQYQTGKSLLLALMLLQHSPYGALQGTYCAADLPVDRDDWRRIESFMEQLAIRFRDADDLDLHLCACGPVDLPAVEQFECCCL